MIIAGLMSGSSLDGLDIAVCEYEGSKADLQWELIEAYTVPFDNYLANHLSQATTLNPMKLAELDSDFASFCARQIKDIAQSFKIDYIASHGHTVYHDPTNGYSTQIGNGGVIAALSDIPCISDFRMNDIALGGHGAPIVPIVEQVLFPEVPYFLNLGGIVNISIHSEDVVAYDICPCNQVLNRLAKQLGQEYDKNGDIAASGQISPELIKSWETLPYFDKSPPKSLDNSWVLKEFYTMLDQFNIKTNDAMTTMVEFIALQISKSLKDDLITHGSKNTEIMITGGGAMNKFMMQRIQLCMPEQIEIKSVKAQLIESKEAILMSLMGYLRIIKEVNTIPSATGASRGSCTGALYLP